VALKRFSKETINWQDFWKEVALLTYVLFIHQRNWKIGSLRIYIWWFSFLLFFMTV
jgi:hypothetical protein